MHSVPRLFKQSGSSHAVGTQTQAPVDVEPVSPPLPPAPEPPAPLPLPPAAEPPAPLPPAAVMPPCRHGRLRL